MGKEKHSPTSSATARLSVILRLEYLQKVKSEPDAGLKGFHKYLTEGPKRPGRPHGTTMDDDWPLRRMKELLGTGEAKNHHDAAQMAAREIGGFATHDSIVSRLRRKYKDNPPGE